MEGHVQYEVSAPGFFAILNHGFEIDHNGVLLINHADGTWDVIGVGEGKQFAVNSFERAVPSYELETTISEEDEEEATLP